MARACIRCGRVMRKVKLKGKPCYRRCMGCKMETVQQDYRFEMEYRFRGAGPWAVVPQWCLLVLTEMEL